LELLRKKITRCGGFAIRSITYQFNCHYLQIANPDKKKWRITNPPQRVVRGEVARKTEDIELPLYFPIIFTEYNYIVNMFIEAYTSLNNMTNYTTHT
jgi:hypothetical protein